MANYYVDTVSGNNGNPGSEAQPWLTVQYGVASITTNDTLYVRGGASYAARRVVTEAVTISAAQGCDNGASGQPITITVYPGEYVEFRAANGSEVFDINGRTYWRLVGPSTYDPTSDEAAFFINVNGNTGSSYGIRIRQDADSCTVSRVRVYNGQVVALVRIEQADDCTVEYSRIHLNGPTAGVDKHGVYITGDDTDRADRNTVRYCEIFDCTDAVQINGTTNEVGNGVDDTILEYNHLYITTPAANTYEDGIDEKVGDATIIRYNTIHGFRTCDGSIGGTGSDGGAIGTHGDCIGTIMYGNLIYDCSGAAFKGQNVTAAGVYFYRNVVRDMYYETAQASSERNFIYIVSTVPTYYIYHNTFVGEYTGEGTGGGSMRFQNNTTAVIRNNIFYDTGTITQGTGLTLTYSYNCWFSCVNTLSGTGDVTSDPLFNSIASSDFRLTASSPCINAGTDLGSPYSTGYIGAAPDMGYFEYGTTTQLIFGSLPSTGQTATNLTTFTVSAAYYDGNTNTSYSTNVVLAKQSGPGTLSGTTTRTPSSGVATFNDIQLSAAGTVTLLATSGSLSEVSNSIEITSSVVPVELPAVMGGLPPALKARREARVWGRR